MQRWLPSWATRTSQEAPALTSRTGHRLTATGTAAAALAMAFAAATATVMVVTPAAAPAAMALVVALWWHREAEAIGLASLEAMAWQAWSRSRLNIMLHG